jgi:hypothetical protein
MRKVGFALFWMVSVALTCQTAMKSQAVEGFGPKEIDRMIRAEWKRAKIIPAAPADDARFLRRVYLDIVGTIPTEEQVRSFLADKSPNKRARVVEELLNSPRYAKYWANYWDNVLMGRQFRAQVVDRAAFRQWLHQQFSQNVPWNKCVYELISATGQNSKGGTYGRVVGVITRMDMEGEAGNGGAGAKVNGAVNWTLKYLQNPADLAGTASRIFLGVQIQCAQCHDHKTEKWTQEDFRQFTACFIQARPIPIDTGQVRGIRRVELREVNRPLFRRLSQRVEGMAAYLAAKPAALDGTDFSNVPSRRKALAEWMTAPENPYFARAIVNRMWAHFLGRGFVNPIDDFRPSNPPVMPELLQKLADDFVAHGYDLKHLIRTICATQVYQLSSGPAKGVDEDNKLWARYRLKPLEPEQMLDALVTATNLHPVLERVIGGNLEQVKFLMQRQFSFLFQVDEEVDQKEFEGTIPQVLMLLNGNLLNRAITPIPGTTLAQVLAQPGTDAEKIETLYLRTLSRKPTAAEIRQWVSFVNAPRDAIITGGSDEQVSPRAQGRQVRRTGGVDPLARLGRRITAGTPTPKQQAYEDLFWALLNSSEFMFNR